MQLVTVVVITYNSAKYVIETLESIKNQCYPLIELIISDDFSSDETIQICRDWLLTNKEYFTNTKLVETPENTGIPANANRGVLNSSGTWFKLIAGDDVLVDNAISNLIDIVEENKQIEVLLTQVEIFRNTFDENNSIGYALQDWQIKNILADEKTSQEQLEYLLKGFPFPGPGFFINKSFFDNLGGYNEDYPYVEDMPFCLKVLQSNKKIYFRKVITVRYRKHSVNSTSLDGKVLPRYYVQYFKALLEASKMFPKRRYIYMNYWDLQIGKLIIKLGNSGQFAKALNFVRIFFHPKRTIKILTGIKILNK